LKDIYPNIINKSRAFIPILMLALFLGSIIIVSFHNHAFNDGADNCNICFFQASYSAATVENNATSIIIQNTSSDYPFLLFDRASDPSQRLISSSHAPPQIS
jgi:hypothetical protein